MPDLGSSPALTKAQLISMLGLTGPDVLGTADTQAATNKTINIDQNTIKHSTTNQVGDLITNDGTKLVRLARGSANQLLSMNASGNANVWINAPAGSGEANTMTNVGNSGVGVYKQKTGVQFEMKKIAAGTNITVTDDTANSTVKLDVTGAGTGDMILANAQTVTGAKTFANTKFLLRNPANTFSATVDAGAITGNYTYTFPARNANDTVVLLAASQTITGKTMDYNNNTFQNFPAAGLLQAVPSTFTVYIDSDNSLKAKNGKTGVVDYSTVASPTSTQRTTFFQSLFTALQTTGGLISLMKGTYVINATLNVGVSGTRAPIIAMHGEERDSTIIQMDGAASVANMFKCYCGIDFTDFTIDANSKGQHLIDQQEGYYTNIENIRFKPGPEIGLFIAGGNGKGMRVADCYFSPTISTYDQAAFTSTNAAVEYMIFERCYFDKRTGTLGGSCLTSACMRNAVITGNVFDRDPTGANMIFGFSLENWGNNYQDIVISNNVFNYGILYMGGTASANKTWKDIVVEGNTIRGGYIDITNGSDATINGCIVTGVTVANNKFAASTGVSIMYNATGYNVVRGNTFNEWNMGGSDPSLGLAHAITTLGNATNLEIVDNTFLQTATGTNQSAWVIRHVNGQNYSIHHNKFIKTNSGGDRGIHNSVGTPVNVKVYDNEGYVTNNEGVTVFNGDNSTTAFAVTHGLGGGGQNVTPTQVVISTNLNILARVSAITSTTFTVTFASAPASGTNNVSIYWRASKLVWP